MKGKGKWTVLLSIMLVLSLFLSACSGGGSSKTEGGKSGSGGKNATKQELNFVSSDDIPSLDIHKATDSTSFTMDYMLQAGLMTVYNSKTEPDLSDGQPQVSDDGKVYTFKIRDGVKWSNGTPITANDFVYAWHRILDKDFGAPYSYIFESAHIKNAAKILDPNSDLYGKVDELGVKAVDDKTLEVTLEKPTPYFLSLMAFPPFFPLNKEFVEQQGKNYALEANSLLYSGPYKLEKWDHGVGWALVKNPDYWDAKSITMEKVNYKIVKDLGTRVNLYQTGKIDRVGLTEEFVNKYKSSPEYQQIPDNCVFYMKLNIAKVPVFQNLKVRQAMSMVIDRKGWTDTLLNNGSIPGNFFVPKDFTFGPDGKDFREPSPNGYDLGDKAKAKKLWDEAKKELGIKTLKVRYLTTDSPQSTKYAEYNAHTIEQALPGFKFVIEKQPWAQYLEQSKSDNFDIAAGSSWCPDYQDPTTFLDIMSEGNTQNSGKWNDKHYNDLLKQADQLGNKPAERWKVLQEAEKYLIEQAPIIPIYQLGGAIMTKPYVKGLVDESYGPSPDFRHATVKPH
ncbi:peptide ABC transporter substrate-binding protein [Camelliibacillus cellulosilyticus]|uniref:Peptide ABC transporter substrate-binding protein n=1 Tax=Camelliibacillus cellulosilyticus TaxID=2174486 RepID=A0ABV9GPE2_9BACL